mmetsp:Transcript_8924/g.15909  ORF Transcript_8924/g.15909 Transcript_8924/m.15909 type:complete len:117 (-) Transcript_8924:6-356(-)
MQVGGYMAVGVSKGGGLNSMPAREHYFRMDAKFFDVQKLVLALDGWWGAASASPIDHTFLHQISAYLILGPKKHKLGSEVAVLASSVVQHFLLYNIMELHLYNSNQSDVLNCSVLS